ncbi:MAG: VCBS repeat-containing protein [Rhodospirillales bacterium]|nr:VCBS repeat-containing protein [Rhodospirillales bacterium]
MKGSSFFVRLPISLLALSLAGVPAAGAQAQDGLVALSGENAPGLPPDVTFDSFGTPVLSSKGDAAFEAKITGPGVHLDNDEGIWFGSGTSFEGPRNILPVAIEGAQAPDTAPGTLFEEPQQPVVNETGGVAFRSGLTGAGVDPENDDGIWVGKPSSGPMVLAVRSGDPAPGTPLGVFFANLIGSTYAFNNGGVIAFLADLDGDRDLVDEDNDEGIWVGKPGQIQLAARKGFAAPGLPAGTRIEQFSGSPVVNGSDQVAFAGTLESEGGVDPGNDEAIWVGKAGQVQLLVREGDEAPGAPGTRFENLANADTPPALNNTGTVAFRSSLDNIEGEIDPERDEGIWAGKPGSVQLVVREGDPAPGTPSGVVFSSFLNPGALVNSTGQVAFIARLRGAGVDAGNDLGIWVGKPGALQLVVRTFDQAPGAPDGVRFESLGTPSLNANGGIAFAAELDGLDVTADNDEGVWGGRAGELVLVAREGDVINFGNDGARTITEVFLVTGSGGEDGKPSGLNDAREAEVAVMVEFGVGPESSGVFISPGTVSAPPAADDFNADLTSDILWRNTSSGATLIWQIENFANVGDSSPGAVGLAWEIRETGDFDKDGDADILWRNTSNGATLIWEMENYAKVGENNLGGVALVWEIRETGDFDKDGDADILWRNTSNGTTLVWEMENLAMIGSRTRGGVSLVWEIRETGDFDDDGDDDIFWRNTSSGATLIWEIEDIKKVGDSSPGPVALVWEIREAGDFDQDGDDDILWRNTSSGATLIWEIENLANVGDNSPGAVALAWEIRGAGDHDGDSDADILWRNTSSGATLIWEIEDFANVGDHSPGAVALVWEIQ